MKSIDINGKQYTIAGELNNGVFYLEGPRGGSVLFAKPVADNLYFFSKATGGASLQDNKGLIVSATREQLAA